VTAETVAGGGCVCPAKHAWALTIPGRGLIHSPGRILRGLVGPGDTVADLGCGPGYFSLPLARMVGPRGSVVAVDLQPAMLTRLVARAEKAGLSERIVAHPCAADTLGELPPLDAALAFYMVHEVPDVERFLGEVSGALKRGGHLLLIEPKGHVHEQAWRETLRLAASCGLAAVEPRRVLQSRAALLRRE